MRSAFALLLLVVFAGGCAGYRLGPTGGYEAGDRTVQINPFHNQTMEPRLTDPVTQQIRKQIQQDGTFRLSTHGRPDISVSGVITKYERVAMSFASGDVATGTDYRVAITAHVTALEVTTGKTILVREVSGYTLVRVGNDLTSAERQALPLLAQDLAKHVTTLLADGAW